MNLQCFLLLAFDSDLLKKLKRPGKQDLAFDNSKTLEKTEKVAFFFIYRSVQQFLNSVRILYPVLVLDPVRSAVRSRQSAVRSPQSAVRSPCFILTATEFELPFSISGFLTIVRCSLRADISYFLCTQTTCHPVHFGGKNKQNGGLRKHSLLGRKFVRGFSLQDSNGYEDLLSRCSRTDIRF